VPTPGAQIAAGTCTQCTQQILLSEEIDKGVLSG
jgi:hypothetical protein